MIVAMSSRTPKASLTSATPRTSRLLTVGALLAVGAVVAGCSSGGDSSSASGAASSEGANTAASPGASDISGITCKPVSGSPKTMQFPAAGNAGADNQLTLTTNCGDIVIKTLPAKSPKTVNSQAFLAEKGYFDFTTCHRITTQGLYVLQCGDPTAQGTGGPGYEYANEYVPGYAADNYPTGTVAMANSGPNTNGSQFFIVYDNTTLPPDYTIWGEVVSGLDIVKYVASKGVEGGGTDGPPAQPLEILSAKAS